MSSDLSPDDAPPTDHASPNAPRRDVAHTLRHVERVLHIRIGVAIVLYVIFVVLDISAALTHAMSQRAPLLLGLLIASIFALPRQVMRRELLAEVQGSVQKEWLARMKRIQTWLVWVRAIFFLGALILFLGLPELV